MLGIQQVPFAIGRSQLVQLADLPGQAFTLTLQRVALAARLVQPRQHTAPGLPDSAERTGIGAGLHIQQRTHSGGARQALPGVLAVDVDQMFCGFAQLRHGGRAAVDPGSALALGIHTAAQQQRVVDIKSGFIQPGPDCGRRVELGADFGPRCAFAYQRCVSAMAQSQLQRVDEDGLARAGLAGQHREARAQVDFELGDDHHVAQ